MPIILQIQEEILYEYDKYYDEAFLGYPTDKEVSIFVGDEGA